MSLLAIGSYDEFGQSFSAATFVFGRWSGDKSVEMRTQF
jgi:hypothetical protein